MSLSEYLSISLFTCLIVFTIEMPTLTLILALLFQSPFFAFITAFSVTLCIIAVFFFAFLNWPKAIIAGRAKSIEKSMPFASLYLATVAGTHLPLHQIFKIFSKFTRYVAINREVASIVHDVDVFGYDIDTALKRAVNRTPSRIFKELLWGLLSTRAAGGDLCAYLQAKSKGYFAEYRRALYEFSHRLTLFVEVYLTAVVLASVFFIVITSIVSGITGVAGNILGIQLLLICIFMPLISLLFILLVKAMTPVGE
jgi:flagellar protein FlaJ